MFRIYVEKVINKDIESVFDLISDHASYKNFPGIESSELLEKGKHEKNGEGAFRRIGTGFFEFQERITCFERPTRMNYHIEKTRPIPIKHIKGEITLERVSAGTRVAWISEGHMNLPIMGNLILDKIVEMKVSKAFQNILKAIERSKSERE